MSNKHVNLIRRLHSRAASMAWEKTEEAGTYESEAAEFAIQISESAEADPLYTLRLFDGEGTLLDEFSDEDLTEFLSKEAPTEGSEMFTLMQDVHRAARRSAMGVDRAIDAILVALGDER